MKRRPSLKALHRVMTKWKTIGEVCVDSGRMMLCDPFSANEASDWWDGYRERTDFNKSPASVEINGTKDFPIGVITSTGFGDGRYAVEARYVETPSWGILVAEIRIRFLPHPQYDISDDDLAGMMPEGAA
jgi:hypothetical protein